jgi:hypothetical protein
LLTRWFLQRSCGSGECHWAQLPAASGSGPDRLRSVSRRTLTARSTGRLPMSSATPVHDPVSFWEIPHTGPGPFLQLPAAPISLR